MRNEAPKNIPELYAQFGNARYRASRWGVPFIVAAAVNIGIGGCTLLTGSREQQSAYGKFGPPAAFLTIGPAVAAGILGSRRQRREAENIAVDIAHREGKMPKHPFAEFRRTDAILMARGVLTQDWSSREAKRQPNEMGITRMIRKAGEKTERRIKDTLFLQVEVALKSARLNEQEKQEARTAAYELALADWTQIANDQEQPDHKRRYAHEMRAELMKRLNTKDQ